MILRSQQNRIKLVTRPDLTQEAGGWVLRWRGPKDDSKVLFYTIEYKIDVGDEWQKLGGSTTRIDKDEASYMSKSKYIAQEKSLITTSHIN